MLAYLCRRTSGVWVLAKEADALMPPYAAVEGPYDYEEAKRTMLDRNLRQGFKPSKKAKRIFNGHSSY